MQKIKFLPRRRRVGVWLCWLSFSCAVAQCLGQGTINITFDGPPAQPPGTAYTTEEYYESGMSFTPLASFGFGRVGSSPKPFRPDNGSAYLQAAFTESLKFSFINGTTFNLDSVELAEYSTVVPNAVTVHFVGYRRDGTIVTTDLTTDGIIDGTGPLIDFQAFNFQGFTGLTRVEIPTDGWSLDNIQVSPNIPEPATTALLLVGGLLLCALRRRPA